MATFKKNQEEKISKYFKYEEFDCNCQYDDCVDQTISDTLVEKLDKVREEFGESLKVTSAFRCAKKQNDLRGLGILTAKKRSTHEDGIAVDIRPLKDNSPAKMARLLQILEKYFDSIGLAKTFYHVDERKGKRRWNY